jgi:site-specific DNA-methyltransferase (adenine-specific)
MTKGATMTSDHRGPWRIVQGDCLKEMARLPAGCARLVFADPPYNLGVDYGNGPQADQLPKRDYLSWCRAWMQYARRLLTEDGSLWCLICDEYAGYFFCLLEECGLHYRSWVKWYETFGVNCSSKYNRTSRHLLYFTCHPRHFVFHAEAVTRPSDRLTKYRDSRANPAGKRWDDVWIIPRLVGNAKERIPGIPTQLPLALLRPVIGCATDPGDLVVDPFAGSATSGVAALEVGRRFLGIEKQGHFAELASQRLRQTVERASRLIS